VASPSSGSVDVTTHKMTLYVSSYNDVVDEAFRRDFPEVSFCRVAGLSELARELPATTILTTSRQRITPELGRMIRELGARLLWIQLTSVGTDLPEGIGLPGHVRLTNAAGIRARVVAGHAISLMLGLMRGFRRYETFRARREWARDEIVQGMRWPGDETIVVCGLGAVGGEAARLAKALGMEVIGVSRTGAPGGLIDEVLPRSRLHDALPRADVLLLAMPLTTDTLAFVGAPELALLKRTSILVNVARGRLLDEAALISALQDGRIAGAGLDVFADEPLEPSSPLWTMDNVLITPHVAGRGGAGQRRALSDLFSENLRRFLAGRPLLNEIEPSSGDRPIVVP
jgi:phosphoglycerate dehydrogenase-like enzyme